MATVLDRIIAATREEVARRQAATPLSAIDATARLQPPPRGFAAALTRKAADGHALIAEIKKASPSKGLIREDFDPPAHARAYEAGGAACLSVLTDKPFFQGDEAYLVAAREACSLPAIRKDFMVDPWQVAEARAIGADAILIIVAALDDGAMAEIEAAAIDHAMDVLVEVHDDAELDRALRLHSRLIGVNNRDLRDFTVDLGRTEALAQRMPEGTEIVAESGLSTKADLDRLAQAGIHRFLVGETLMRQADVAEATRRLLIGA
ncbi:indole-3-glycerol phosphate synthase TrpC [Sphingomonas abietis]|uniref:Indole-3-glycerol phosphate synthase n=1 Tax=Sphingomonas abietis TaxID=3012344 RepID=A0ABY7NQ46_9SPHN|nr:indole-3-glycerol phosphate synthase TrpC [Sphingomonas abietis]WBO23666.1 indole-3-glycerol phosphate synthase TrpC [Sphingomonas abietis]